MLRDVIDGKVSLKASREDYGVVLVGSDDDCTLDEAATATLRAEMKAQRTAPLPMIDRGPGYQNMLDRKR